jgi:hypothetical protein
MTILGLSSVFDLQNQVRLFNIERLKTKILESKDAVRSLSIDEKACEYADMFVHSEQRHLEQEHFIDPHLQGQINHKIELLRTCEIVRLARKGKFDTSVKTINEFLNNSTLSEFGFHDVVAALETHATNLQEFEKLNSLSYDDQPLGMKVFGIVLTCFGIVVKISRTTAEICKWHR